MSDDFPSTIPEHAAFFDSIQKVAAKTCRRSSYDGYGDLVKANKLLIGAISSSTQRILGTPAGITEELEARSHLIASFLIGIKACELTIVNGQYLQAGALLRQALETIVTIDKVKEGTHQDGKSNKVSHLVEPLRVLHGELSAAAHASKKRVVGGSVQYIEEHPNEAEDCSIWRYYPQHIPSLSKSLYGVHTTLLLHFFNTLTDYFFDLYGKEPTQIEIDSFNRAVDILEKEGFMKWEPYSK